MRAYNCAMSEKKSAFATERRGLAAVPNVSFYRHEIRFELVKA
jgi:hypothetical protein